MEDRELQEFLERLGQEQKERERVAIQALILAKESRIAQTKLTSIESLKEISEGMYQQTNNGLPSTLKLSKQTSDTRSTRRNRSSVSKL